jgi:toxin ParE1/3/4
LDRAGAYRDRLRGVMEGLLIFPGGGAPFDPRLPGVRSIKAGEHRIFYTADEDKVRIVRILHAAMELHRHLP